MTITTQARIGGSASPSTDQLVHAGRVIVDHYGISFTTSRLLRLAIKFKTFAPHGDKFLFFQFLSAQIDLSEQQKQQALSAPDIARVLSYPDPVGEEATNNVMRERRRHG